MAERLWPTRPLDREIIGRPSRKAATAALEAHLAVGKGSPMRLAVSEALEEAEGLGGQERRFCAVAARELSRHLRLLDLAAKYVGLSPGDLKLPEDRALVRYAIWRRLFTGASWREVGAEVKLPGPIRPRTLRDDVLENAVTAPLPDDAELSPQDAAATRHSFPNWLAQALAREVPEAELDPLLAALNAEPNVFLRARPAGAREQRLAELREAGIGCAPVDWVPDAIRITDRGMKVFESAPVKRGLLQVQEPGSQLIAQACATPGARSAADVCAGAGGKTIALADVLGKGVRIYAGDKSSKRLDEARRRVKAARVEGVSFPKALPLSEVDVALIDAPCSGTGSLAREPEQKWRLTAQKIGEFAKTQRELLSDVARQLKPGAVLVYATCSLLREEDEDVVAAFLSKHPAFIVEPLAEVLGPGAAQVLSGPYARVFPHRTQAGGFFAARLRKRADG